LDEVEKGGTERGFSSTTLGINFSTMLGINFSTTLGINFSTTLGINESHPLRHHDTNNKNMITIKKLPEERWQEYRDLRLEALEKEPLAFSSSYEDEQSTPENIWRQRINNNMFILADDKPVGVAGFARNTHKKTNHVCEMFGVYVRKEYRGQGIGKKLIEAVLAEMQQIEGVKILEVGVNPTQKAAKHIYQNYGFKTVGHFRKWMCVDGKYYDTLIMEKRL
jgi:RimJ/RimL family protein N-acetyltransferase